MSNRGTLARIFKAVKELNPGNAAREAARPLVFSLVGTSEDEIAVMRDFLLGHTPSPRDISRASKVIKSHVQPLDDKQLRDAAKSDVVLAADGAETGFEHAADKLFAFDSQHPELAVKAIAGSKWGRECGLSLARALPAFRAEIARRIVRDVSRENAVFVIATSLGNFVPSPIQPLLGIAEAASDTVVLTANQVRMLFMLGAVHGANIGYAAQWKELSSIVGAAFGWRALARELVSKIPFGAGVVPKGAVAYAGTTAVGEGLLFFYATGRKMTRAEVSQAFRKAYSEAVEVVRSLVGKSRAGTPEGDDPDLS